MKTIFRSIVAAAAVIMAVSCGNTASKNAQQAANAMADEAPTVAVEQVSVREVPQLATYTSTVQAYVKNNIAPQMSGRITKINVEIGDNVTKGQVLAEMDKTSLLQAQLQLQNQAVELQRLKTLKENGAISQSDYDAVELAYSGAQVIHPKTIRPLENKKSPLYVKPFGDHTAPGSVITAQAESINVPVYIWRANQMLITLRAKDFSFVLEESLSHIFDIIHRNRLKVSLIQSSAVTISVCVDNTRFVKQAIEQLQEAYRVVWNEGLSLLTIRGTTPEILRKEQDGRDILLSQLTRRTAKLVIKD